MSLFTRQLFLRRIILLVLLIAGGAAEAAPMRVGLVLNRAGKDDKSFNSAAFVGVTRAEKELKIQAKTVEATDDNSFEPLLRAFAQKKFDLVVSVGVQQMESLAKVAVQFPNTKFAIIDAEVKQPNVRSLLFEEHEGSYLVGAIAGLTSKTGKVGFIGGMDIPLIRRFQMGFEAGVKKTNPKATLYANYIGVTGDAWSNAPRGKELALSQFEKGADIVFTAAGTSGLGVFDAAEEKKKLAIGVDSNQNWIKPGTILTSMLKRVDVAVFEACRDLNEGKFTAGTVRYGLMNQGIDFSMDEHNRSLISQKTLDAVAGLKKDIVGGKIKVPDFYSTQKK